MDIQLVWAVVRTSVPCLRLVFVCGYLWGSRAQVFQRESLSCRHTKQKGAQFTRQGKIISRKSKASMPMSWKPQKSWHVRWSHSLEPRVPLADMPSCWLLAAFLWVFSSKEEVLSQGLGIHLGRKSWKWVEGWLRSTAAIRIIRTHLSLQYILMLGLTRLHDKTRESKLSKTIKKLVASHGMETQNFLALLSSDKLKAFT